MLFLFVLLLDALNTNFFLAALPNLLGVVTWQSDLDQPPLELGPSPGPLDWCKYPHGTHGEIWGMPFMDHGIPGHHGQCISMHKLDVQINIKSIYIRWCTSTMICHWAACFETFKTDWKAGGSPVNGFAKQEEIIPMRWKTCTSSGAAVKQKSSAPGLSDLLRFHLQRSPAASQVWHPAPPRRLLRSWAVDDLGRWCHWTWCFEKSWHCLWHRFSLDLYIYIYYNK